MATIIWATGFEHGLSTLSANGGGIVSALSGSTITTVGSGIAHNNQGYALSMIIPSGASTIYISRTLSSPSYLVGSLYLMVPTGELPSSVSLSKVRIYVGGVSTYIYLKPSTMRYMWYQSGYTGADGSVDVEQGKWHRVDFRINGPAKTVDWAMDGIAQTQYVHGISGAITDFRLSNASASIPLYTYYDDVVLSTTPEDYPIGEHFIVGSRPYADGTHNAGTNIIEDESGNDIGTVSAYTLIDEDPWSSSPSTYIRQNATGSGNYAEIQFTDYNYTQPIGAVALLQYRSSATTANEGATIVTDEDGTETTVWGSRTSKADYSESSSFYKYAVLPTPAGGWDTNAANALKSKMGFSNNVASVPYWTNLLTEIIYSGSPVQASTGGLKVITGAEYGLPFISTSGQGLFDGAGGTTVQISSEYTSSNLSNYSYKFDTYSGGGSSTCWVDFQTNTIGSNSTVEVGSAYVLFKNFPDTDIEVFGANNVVGSGNYVILSKSPRWFGVKCAGNITSSDVTVTSGVWYRLDWKIDVSANPWTMDLQVNGKPITQGTAALPATTHTTASIGWVNSDSALMYVDDYMLSTNADDYPIGGHTVWGAYADDAPSVGNPGTNILEAQNGADLTAANRANAYMGQIPWSNTDTTYVRQWATGSGNYADIAFNTQFYSYVPQTYLGARVILQYGASGVSTNTGGFYVLDEDGNKTTVWGTPGALADYSETAMHYKSAMMPEPVNGWDEAAVDAMIGRLGFSDNATTQPRWYAAIAEVGVKDIKTGHTLSKYAYTKGKILATPSSKSAYTNGSSAAIPITGSKSAYLRGQKTARTWSFPKASILDNFNRSSLGSDWTVESGTPTMDGSVVGTSTTSSTSILWKDNKGPGVDVFVTIGNLPVSTEGDAHIDYDKTGGTNYRLYTTNLSQTSIKIHVYKYTTSWVEIISTGTLTYSTRTSVKFGVRHNPNGDIYIYLDGGNGWEMVGSGNDLHVFSTGGTSLRWYRSGAVPQHTYDDWGIETLSDSYVNNGATAYTQGKSTLTSSKSAFIRGSSIYRLTSAGVMVETKYVTKTLLTSAGVMVEWYYASKDNQAAYIEGGLPTASDNQAAYTKGKSTFSGSKAAYTRGQSLIIANKAAYTKGKSLITGNKAAYTKGRSSTTANKTAYTRGSSVYISNKAAYTKGKASIVANKSAYTSGKNTLVGSKSAYTKGSILSYASKSAFIQGSYEFEIEWIKLALPPSQVLTTSTSKAAYIRGLSTNSYSKSAYIGGKSTSLHNKAAYTKGKDISTTSRFAYTGGKFSASASKSVYTRGQSSYTTSKAAFIQGKSTSTANKFVYTKGKSDALSNKNAYTKGSSFTTYNKAAYTEGASVSLATSRFAYTKGKSVFVANKFVYTQGKDTSISNKPVYISGKSSIVANKAAYTKGQSTLIANKAAYLQGKYGATTSRTAYTKGKTDVVGNKAAFTRGGVIFTGNRAAYTRGKLTEITSRYAYTRGSSSYVTSKSAYTKGISGISASESAYTKGLSTYSSIEPAYIKGDIPWYLASDLTIVVGSGVSGVLSDTYSRNDVSLVLAEEGGAPPGFTYDFTFGTYNNVPTISGLSVHLWARYSGNLGHNVKIQEYNYNTANFDNITLASTDFINSPTIDFYNFDLLHDSKYISSGIVILRITHTSPGNITHQFFIDDLRLVTDTADSIKFAYTRGKDTSVGNKPAFTNGKSSQVASKAAFIEGKSTYSSTKSAYTRGSLSTSINKFAYTKGKADSVSNKWAYTRGSSVITSNKWAYTKGKADYVDNQPAYVVGKSTYSSIKSAYTCGGVISSDNKPAYIAGQINITDNQPAYIEGYAPGIASQKAYTKGLDSSAYSHSAFVQGSYEFEIEWVQVSLPPTQISLVTANKPAYIVGESSFVSNRYAYTSGKSAVSDNQPAYIVGKSTHQDNRFAFTHGKDTQVANKAAYTGGKFSSIANKAAFIQGKDTKTTFKWAFTAGGIKISGNKAAYLRGASQLVANKPAYINGLSEGNVASKSAYTRGSSSYVASKPAYLRGASSYQTSKYAYTKGKDTYTVFKPAYLVGKTSVVYSRYAYTRGSSPFTSSRYAYTKGGVVASDNQPAFVAVRATATGFVHAYLEGFAANTTTKWAYTKGKSSYVSNKAAFTSGGIKASKSAYIKGSLTVSDNQFAYTSGQSSTNSKKFAYISGKNLVNYQKSAYICGKSTSQTLTKAYLCGKIVLSGNKAAFVKGRDTASASKAAYISGKSTTNVSSVHAYTQGGIVARDSQQAFIAAIAIVDTYRHAYLTGFLANVANKPAFTYGAELVRSSRHAYLSGTVPTVVHIIECKVVINSGIKDKVVVNTGLASNVKINAKVNINTTINTMIGYAVIINSIVNRNVKI